MDIASGGEGTGGQDATTVDPGAAEADQQRWRPTLSPTSLAYLIGPVALVAVLFLMHFGDIARESAWLWLGVFIAIPLASVATTYAYTVRPSTFRLHLRVMAQAAAVTTVIYLTGWGPVLWGAFAFLALENVSFAGSRVWTITAFWCLTGMAVGQLCIAQGWAPVLLSKSQSHSLALMGAFVLFFVIRMAGASTRLAEEAESAVRLSEERFRSLIQNSSDATTVMDVDGLFTYVSPAMTDLLGYSPDDLLEKRATDFVHEDDWDRVRERLGQTFQASPGTELLQFRMARRGGEWCDVEAVVTNLVDRPAVAGYVANIRDITERKRFETILAHRALHDPLTELPNRQLILDRAEQMLARTTRNSEQMAVFFIDLDNFKDANDSLGHEAGDRLLQAVAARFQSMLRASDTVGRLGGDEFVILTEGTSLGAGPEMISDRIRDVLRAPFRVAGFEAHPINVTASVGIATGGRASAQELLRDADIALYQSKAAGKDRSVLFEPSMQRAVLTQMELRSDLNAALANDEFFLQYQPIFDLRTLKIHGVEALLRWRHPVRGVTSPLDFISVMEENGSIIDVGRWVLDQACAQAATWREMGHDLSVSVNVSVRQLELEGFVDHVCFALAESTLNPSSLVLEVTESTLMKDPAATVSRLKRLKQLGLGVAIDDFGTGYSSLAYLREFPVDVLKIDRSFISDMGSPDSTSFIRTLVELGRSLGLVTLAEGIEDQDQLERLRLQDCDRGQGFFLCRPADPDAIEVLLEATASEAGTASPAVVTSR